EIAGVVFFGIPGHSNEKPGVGEAPATVFTSGVRARLRAHNSGMTMADEMHVGFLALGAVFVLATFLRLYCDWARDCRVEAVELKLALVRQRVRELEEENERTIRPFFHPHD